MRIERHPIGIWVREDGCIYLPQSGKKPAHWTFGTKRTDGYLSVMINGKNYRVHRLVAEVFIPNPENKKEIDHIDRCPAHNNAANLKWSTRSENLRNTSAHDRINARNGTHKYEDEKQYWRERDSRRRKTHKYVRFSDGKYLWVPNSEALELLKLPVKKRHYGNG